ncbi:MAG: glycosyl hydrolase-related protein, partial [Bacillota bacterium]
NKKIDSKTVNWQPQRHWEVHFIPITHHDLGYTDPVDSIYNKYQSIYKDVLEFCQYTDNWPEKSRYRYTVENSWSLDYFLQNSSQATVNQFMNYVKEGRIEVSAFYANIIDAMCGHEEIIRSLYPSFKLKKKYDIPINTASIVDIPGLSWSLPSILAKAGIRYFFAGLPTYFEWKREAIDELPAHIFWDENKILRNGRPDAFKWQGPDGSSVLVYYQGSYGWFQGGMPDSELAPETFAEVRNELPVYLKEMEEKGSPFSVMRYIDHGLDNFPPQKTISKIAKEWNQKYVYPELIVSTNQKFFKRLEKDCSDLRTFTGELPHTDYTICATSKARETGLNRITHDRLNSTERLSTVSNILTEDNYPLSEINHIYKDVLLYDEHCFGMSKPLGKIQDWNWSSKQHYAYRAAGKTDSLLDSRLENIAKNIYYNDDNKHIVVFNPLSFARTDIVRIRNFAIPKKDFIIIDEDSSKKVNYQITEVNKHDLPVANAAERYALGKIYNKYKFDLVFVAEDIPALGYKSFKIVTQDQKERNESHNNCPQRQVDEIDRISILENQFYKIKLNEKTGNIVKIFDKKLKKELVDKDVEHKFNQLVVNNVETGEQIKPEIEEIKPGVNGAVYKSLLISNKVKGCPKLTQEIILYNNIKKIEIKNRLLKDTTPFQEFYFAFPFAVDNPQFKYEGTNSVIEPFIDQFPGSNTNYYFVQHWAEVSNSDIKIILSPLEAGNLEFGGLWTSYVSQAHHGLAPKDYGEGFINPEKIEKGHIYSYILNGNFRTNFSPVQKGDMLFSYSITSRKVENNNDSSNPYKFGWRNSNPLLGTTVKGSKQGNLDKKFSFCQLTPENVFILNFKKAEDGHGFILRLLEMQGKNCEAVLKFSDFKIDSVYLTNIVEENKKIITENKINNHQIKLSIKPYEIKTLRLIPDKK